MQPLNTHGDDRPGPLIDSASDTSRLADEQWTRVKDIFHQALDLPAAERSPFIREACEGDAALEAALESLLASDDSAREFLETPAIARVGLPSHSTATLAAGDRLGAYEIVALLGAGGMGEVYRARDARLERDVAIKVLPAPLMNDVVRRQWLMREAQAAAALDHPNICAIFDIGEQNGRIWIAMQFVEGETLAERLKRGALTLVTALDVAMQIASALSAAHARGIVHRDVKPENVMITATGQVKVLDFGLAKIAANHGPESLRSGQSAVHTRRLGTLPYMSPEQLRGESLDARTDVFSLSVVLFEMVTGRRPFDRDSNATVVTPIPSLTPPLVTEFVPTIAEALGPIVRKGLESDSAGRYQTMSALAADLARLRQRVEAPSPERTSRPVLLMAAAAVLIAVVAWWLVGGRENQTRLTASLQYTRLTNFPDIVHSPALSPDGTKVAFVRGAEQFSMAGLGNDLYVKTLPDGEPVALTRDGTRKASPTFSPDGSRIVYESPARDGLRSSFSIPVTGGAPTLFIRNASGVRWIGPRTILFSEVRTPPNMRVVTATDERTSVREIYRPGSAQGMAHSAERSPDGRQVLVVEMDHATWLPCRVVPFDGSSQGRSIGPAGAECTSAAWSPDGRWMYLAAAANGESHLWRQRFPHGSPEQITYGPSEEWGLAVDPDGRSVITSVGATQSVVWYHDARGDRALSVEGYAYRPLVSPDGRKVFYLIRRQGTRSLALGELWAADVGPGRSERVLPGVLMRFYHVSRDGKFLVFDALDRNGHSRVWLTPFDHSHPSRQLTPVEGAEEQRPFFGQSGRIHFMQERSPGLYSWYRMKQDGSERQRISEDVHFLMNITPDERWAVSWQSGGVSLVPVQGGAPVPLCTCGLGPIYPDSPSVAWSGDGQSIYLFAGLRALSIPWHGAATLRAVTGPSLSEWEKLPQARYISDVTSLAPGPTSAVYAFVRQSTQRNLYRIQLP